MAGIEDVGRQSERNVFVAAQQCVAVKFIASIAAELDSVVVVTQAYAAVVIRSLELDRPAFGVQHRRLAALHAKNLRVRARCPQQHQDGERPLDSSAHVTGFCRSDGPARLPLTKQEAWPLRP